MRAEYWAQRARCLDLLGRRDEALICVERAAVLPGIDALSADTLGNVLVRVGRHEDALALFERAVAAAPNRPSYLYNRMTALMHCGRLGEARAACERLLTIDPDHARALLALAEMLDGPASSDAIDRLEVALDRAAGDVDRMLVVGHALALSYESTGDTGRAFALWQRTKAEKRSALNFTINDDRDIFSVIERIFPVIREADKDSGHPGNRPIFVVGLPRTGTTLLERLLGSHTAVTAGGELTCLPLALRDLTGPADSRLISAAGIEAAADLAPDAIGRRYLERAAVHVGIEGRFVDKLPLNFFLVGFIRRALPGARIVCLRRGALDTCLATFRQLFALGFPHYRYSLSLDDTAQYVALFTRLMAHWDRCFPGGVHYVEYESLVTEPEAEIRRLLGFLDLDFEPSMMCLERNATPVATASAVQVRRPLHRRSVGAWRRYEHELEPVRRRLMDLGVQPEPGG